MTIGGIHLILVAVAIENLLFIFIHPLQSKPARLTDRLQKKFGGWSGPAAFF